MAKSAGRLLDAGLAACFNNPMRPRFFLPQAQRPERLVVTLDPARRATATQVAATLAASNSSPNGLVQRPRPVAPAYGTRSIDDADMALVFIGQPNVLRRQGKILGGDGR